MPKIARTESGRGGGRGRESRSRGQRTRGVRGLGRTAGRRRSLEVQERRATGSIFRRYDTRSHGDVDPRVTLLFRKRSNTVSGIQAKFRDHGVVPDVIDNPPPDGLKVFYGENLDIEYGTITTPTLVKDPPQITWTASNREFFTLCMTDPDAPSRAHPEFREWHHWLVGNIPGNRIAEGQVLSEYVGAGPPVGTGYHRYVFLLYKQPKGEIDFSVPRLTNRAFRPSTNEKNQEKLKLRLYEAYAWGVPFIIVFIGAVSDLACRGGECDILRPRFGEKSCWFYGEKEDFPYFYGPMGTLLLVNLLLFLLTARELTCGMWKSELVKATTERAALGLVCLKLVVVMGVTWTADVISWAVGGPKEIWLATDIINALQGVFIFIVVVCQKQVLQAVKRAWMMTVKHRGQNGNANATNHHSSSSQGLPSVGDTLTNTHSVTMNTTQNTNSLNSKNGDTKPPLETSC